ATGEKVALEIIRHHRLLELYLREVMGYSWDKVHEEAEHLEHHISEEFEQKIDELLGFPTHDPHGDPIPTRDGEMADVTTHQLADVDPGLAVMVQRVSDTDPAMLGYLEEIGLLPGVTVKIVEKAPFHGPITLLVNGDERVIGYRIASNVFVEQLVVNN
ncbi:MAG: metal-dependent transcriptional regulator, partial [Rhodothermales bacterium]